MTAQVQNEPIRVTAFSSFVMEYGGRRIVINKQHGSQFELLLQMLLHFKEQGVSRAMLKDALFADREVEDEQHALRNLIYNVKRRLQTSGLPDVNYITQKKGVYYWTESIPVVEDARMLETHYRAAQETADPKKQIRELEAAYRLYTGPFLGGWNSISWIAQESRHYHDLFRECVMKLIELFRAAQDYKKLYDVALYAAKVDPFSQWESAMLEAMIALGNYDGAQDLYDETVEKYVHEYGKRTSANVQELIRKLNDHMLYPLDEINEIQNKLTRPASDNGGGYYCSFSSFQEAYRTVERTMERFGDKAFLMLCTLVDSKGNPMKESAKKDELSERLGQVVVTSVRHSDTVTRYGTGQYLVLLVNTTRENCSIVERRITQNFMQGRQRISVDYAVNSVILPFEHNELNPPPKA